MSTVPHDFFAYDYMTGRDAEGWPPPGTPVIRYRRASSENQYARGHGLDDQRAELERVEAQHGYTCVGDVEEVYSGTYTHRPGLERVYALLQSGAARHVLLLNLGRMSRAERPIDAMIIRDMIQQAGGTLLVPGRDYTGDVGDMIFTMDTTQYSRERKDFLVRMHQRRENRVKNDGRPTGTGKAADGYRLVDIPALKLKRAKYELDDARWPIVRAIILLAGERVSLRRIIAWLDVEGYHPSTWTPTNPVRWTTSRIRDILSNPIYEGKPVALRYRVRRQQRPGTTDMMTMIRTRPAEEWVGLAEGTAPAIVTAEERARAIAAMSQNRTALRPTKRDGYLLAGGLAVCGHCGKWVSAVTAGRPNGQAPDQYYRCAKANEQGVAACPGIGSVRRDVLDDAVWQAIMDVAREPERLRAWAETSLEHDLPEAREAEAIAARLAKTMRQRDQTSERLDTDTDMTADERAATMLRLRGFRKDVADLTTRRAELQHVLSQRDARLATVDRLIVTLDDMAAAIADTPPAERRQAALWLGVRVTVWGKDRWEITLGESPGVVSEVSRTLKNTARSQHARLRVPLPLPREEIA